MFALRTLTGPNPGKVYSLKEGVQRLGRSSAAEICIPSKGISKVHAEIRLKEGYAEIIDLDSSNGVFVEGKRVKSARVYPGTRIAFFDIICDFVQVDLAPVVQNQRTASLAPQPLPSLPSFESMPPPPQSSTQPHAQVQTQPSKPVGPIAGALLALQDYMERVVLPGLYGLVEKVDLRHVLVGLIALIVVATTSLSVLPMLKMARSSVQKEAERRALSLARSLAKQNDRALSQGLESALSTSSMRLEDGVVDAVIIKQVDGTIVAPIDRAGQSHKYTFTVKAIKNSSETVENYDISKIGAAVPLRFYVPELGTFSIKYYAVVIYDSDVLSIDSNQAASLFIETLFIALIIASIIGYFILRLIEFPYFLLTREIDIALREKRDFIKIQFQYKPLQKFIEALIPMLSRSALANDLDSGAGFATRNTTIEAETLVQLFANPALAYHPDGYILSANGHFEGLINRGLAQLQNQNLFAIPDQSLQKNLVDLIDSMTMSQQDVAESSLEFNNEPYVILAQRFQGEKGNTAYFVFSFQPGYQQLESAG